MMETDLAQSKILIVDDEPANVLLLEMLLGHAGFSNLRSTTDSRQVIALYRDFDPDVVLLDLSMPHFDGFEIMGRLRELIPVESYMPILVLTAMTTAEAKRRALSAGANDFLTKPFDATEVILRVKNLLETRRLHLDLQRYNATLESTVKERTRELVSALAELQETQHQVINQERLHAFSVMAGGVAHDFNNVLGIVLGFGELVLMDCEGSPGREKDAAAVRSIITAAQDGSRMVSRLREFYRPEGSHIQLSLPVDFYGLAKQAISLTEPRWKSQALKGGIVIKVALVGMKDLPPVLGDPSELREVLTNLIFNAVDAMPEGGTITVHTRAESENVIVEVSDTGSGMTEEVRRRCLEPFYTTKGEGGTGLGLAMVYGIAKRHGASMEIESESGRGATFRFRFPAKALPEKNGEVAEIEWARPLKILLVDDQEFIREILMLFLGEDCHSVDAVSDGMEAMDYLQRRQYDLVITDQAMPEMTGGELATAVKKQSPDTRVILLTGFGAEEAPADGADAIDLVVGKPVTKAILRQAISNVLANH